MFRLLRVINRPSTEPTQDCLIHSQLWDPIALTNINVAWEYSHATLMFVGGNGLIVCYNT